MRVSEPVTDPDKAVRLLRKAIPKGMIGLQECLVVLAVDTMFRVIGKPILVAVGTANNVGIHPRDVFREAIRRNAIGILVAHNHPSGDLKPSLQDKDLAFKLEQAGRVLDIQVLDHIILGKHNHNSMSEGGWA